MDTTPEYQATEQEKLLYAATNAELYALTVDYTAKCYAAEDDYNAQRASMDDAYAANVARLKSAYKKKRDPLRAEYHVKREALLVASQEAVRTIAEGFRSELEKG